jgi:hypothetical protein
MAKTNTTATDFANAISKFRTTGRFSVDSGVWTLDNFQMIKSIGDDGMLGYLITDTTTSNTAFMSWEDSVSDPNGLVEAVLAL